MFIKYTWKTTNPVFWLGYEWCYFSACSSIFPVQLWKKVVFIKCEIKEDTLHFKRKCSDGVSLIGCHRKKPGGSGEAQLVNKASSGWRGLSDTAWLLRVCREVWMLYSGVSGRRRRGLGYLWGETGKKAEGDDWGERLPWGTRKVSGERTDAQAQASGSSLLMWAQQGHLGKQILPCLPQHPESSSKVTSLDIRGLPFPSLPHPQLLYRVGWNGTFSMETDKCLFNSQKVWSQSQPICQEVSWWGNPRGHQTAAEEAWGQTKPALNRSSGTGGRSGTEETSAQFCPWGHKYLQRGGTLFQCHCKWTNSLWRLL